jgi:hypothetical protein
MTATKIIRDKEYGCWSVLLHDEASGKDYWMDVCYDEKYREINIDWNQYIFYLTDEDDMEREAFQENCDNFDEATSEVYWTLLREGEIKDTDDGYVEITVENWKEKTFEIRQ